MIRRFNTRLAMTGTAAFGTIWAFYLFLAYGLLPVAFPDQTVTLLYWSNVVQLVALPMIMVGQNIQTKVTEALIKETHDIVAAEADTIRDLIEELHKTK